MFKVVALLAVVGLASAGVSLRDAVALQDQINTQNAINFNGAVRNGLVAGHHVAAGLPLAYSAGVPALAYSAGYPAVGLAYNPLRVNDAISLNSQVATQHALNVNGAVTSAVNQQNQIATVNAINAHGAARNAVLGHAQQFGAVPVAYSAGIPALAHAAVPSAVFARGAVVASGEHVNAVNNQINTQIAFEQGLVARHQGALAAAHLDAPLFF